MPSVSSVELTNTFDDWRNRTNDIVTEINKANSVDPNSAIVFANSTSGFQVAEVVSDSVTGTLVTGTRLTFTGGNINFTSANTTSLGNVLQTHILGGTAIDVASPSLADTSIANTFIYNSKIDLNGQKFVTGTSTMNFDGATITSLGTISSANLTASVDDAVRITNPSIIVNSETVGGITLSAGTHDFNGANIQNMYMNTSRVQSSTVEASNVVVNGAGFLVSTNAVALAIDVGLAHTSNVGIGKYTEVSTNIGSEKRPTSSKGKLHIRTEYAAASDYAAWDGSSGTITTFNVDTFADELVLESNADAGMTILCNTASNGVIAFADIDDTDIGFVTYDHTNDRMMIGANAANAFMIDSEFGSSVQIPGTRTLGTQAGKLHVNVGATDGTTGLYIDSNDDDQKAIQIDADQTSVNVVNITTTTLTSGSAIAIDDNSASTGERTLIDIKQNHASATGGTALKIATDGMKAVDIVQNKTDKVALNVSASGVQTEPLVSFINSGDADDITLFVKNARTDGGLIMQVANNSTTGAFVVSANGNIGINDSTPTFKMDVNGTFRTTGAATFDSTLSVTSGVTLSATLGVSGIATFTSGSGTTTIIGNSVISDGVECRLKVLDSDGSLINS